MRSRAVLVTLAGVALGAAPARTPAPAPLLAVAGRLNTNPSIAARGNVVVVAWSATTPPPAAASSGAPAASASVTDVFVAASRDGGITFAPPVRVNSTPGDARVGGELPPRVALVPGGEEPAIVVVWTSRTAEGTRLLTSRSTDGGRSFAVASVVPGGTGPGNRGWESVAVDDRGRVHVLWLDHREATRAAPMHHQHEAASASGARAPAAGAPPASDLVERAGLSQLFTSALDGERALSVARGVCYCCKTALVASHGVLYAAWRHVFAGNQRDIAFTVSRDGGRSYRAPARVSEDRWAFDGCPENGPSLAVDHARRVHVFWVTPPDGRTGTPLALFHASTRDGVRFTARTQLRSNGAAHHVESAVAPDGTLVVAWDEFVDGRRRIAVRRGRVEDGGAVTFSAVAVATGTDESWRPVLATARGGVQLAWVTEQGIRVAALR